MQNYKHPCRNANKTIHFASFKFQECIEFIFTACKWSFLRACDSQKTLSGQHFRIEAKSGGKGTQ
jgi:hypothetical protein